MVDINKIRVFKVLRGVITSPIYRYRALAKYGFLKYVSDRRFLETLYRLEFGRKPDLDNPQTFNEKLQWLKLYDRKPIYSKMVDKYEVKEYVKDIIGEQYVIPTYGVWAKFDDIDFSMLPNRFVMKCTHDSGGLVIVEDKSDFDKRAAMKKISSCLKVDFFNCAREWPYKNVEPRIIAEKYMVDIEPELIGYKVECFNGSINCKFDCSDNGIKVELLDESWNYLPLIRKYSILKKEKDKSNQCKKIREYIKELNVDLSSVRVDCYEYNNLFLVDMIFYPGGGLDESRLERGGTEMGRIKKLPGKSSGWLIENKDTLIWAHEDKGLIDYKFYCFEGEPKIIYVSQGLYNHDNAKRTFLSMDWEFVPFTKIGYVGFSELPSKPRHFEEMIDICRLLSKGMHFIRVDLYEIGDNIYFSELTFYPGGGFSRFDPEEYDLKLGNLINI